MEVMSQGLQLSNRLTLSFALMVYLHTLLDLQTRVPHLNSRWGQLANSTPQKVSFEA